MWYVFDPIFRNLQGIISHFSEMTIQHNFYEVDTMTFAIPFDVDTYDTLRTGRILYRKNSNKGFLIHTLDIQESEQTIIGYAYGLESLLDNRVVIHPTHLHHPAEQVMHILVENNMVNAKDSYRNIPHLVRKGNLLRGRLIEEGYWGESLYAIMTELGRRTKFGFKIFFNPIEKVYEFTTRVGVDRTIIQTENTPIRWVHEWNDTFDEVLTSSQKDCKTNVYVASGDDTPLQIAVGDELSFIGGWSRKEMFVQASDITNTLQDENETTLTEAQEKDLLRSRGRLELAGKKPIYDYTFTLNEVDEVYGVDYVEGDYVSVVNQKYGMVKHAQIVTVEEHIAGDLSRFNVKFDEGGM